MAVKPIPEGYQSVTPYLTVPDVAQEIEFVKQAFGATVAEAFEMGGAIMHADVLIRGAHVMIGASSEQWPPRPGTLYLYTEDCDAMYRSALAAGATSVREPTNEFYGDRSAGVVDAQGNQWWMATHVEDVSPEEMQRRAAEHMA
jgi:PhnB protein